MSSTPDIPRDPMTDTEQAGSQAPLTEFSSDVFDQLNYTDFVTSISKLFKRVFPTKPDDEIQVISNEWLDKFRTTKTKDGKFDVFTSLGLLLGYIYENSSLSSKPSPKAHDAVFIRQVNESAARMTVSESFQFTMLCIGMLPNIYPSTTTDEKIISKALTLTGLIGTTTLFSVGILGEVLSNIGDRVSEAQTEATQALESQKQRVESMVRDALKTFNTIINEVYSLNLKQQPQGVETAIEFLRNATNQINQINAKNYTDIAKLKSDYLNILSKLPERLSSDYKVQGLNQRWKSQIASISKALI